MITRTASLTLTATLLAASTTLAQPSMQVEFGRALDSLTFDGSGESRDITALSADLEYQALDERLRLHYALDTSTFSTPGEWGTFLHAGGGTWRFALGPQGTHAIYVGGTASARLNGLSWEAADFHALSAFVNAEFKPSVTIALRTGYRIDGRTFPEYAALNQAEHQFFGSALANLPTRTTLVGEVYGGWKTYDAVPAAASRVHGSGGAAPGTGGQGQGRPTFGVSPSFTTVVADGIPATTASAVTVYGRVAQGLAQRTGLSVDISARNTFGDLPPAVINTPARFFDDGVYDDPYASDATSASAVLTHMWASLTELRASVWWSDREYSSTPAYGLDGAPLPDGTLRADTIWRGGVRLTLPVAASRTGPWKVKIVGGYDYTRSRSTDAFYQYTSHAIGLGASLSY